MKVIFRFFPALIGLTLLPALAHAAGVPVTYQLPAGADVPATYLVTLAITDAKNPDWIVSTFVAGQPRTVTRENGGRFTETWDGLDENHMPVPPGQYGVKGIFAKAHQWSVDGEWHAITPVYNGGVGPWLPPRDHDTDSIPFGGDPVNAPLRDVAVGPNGVAVFYYQYLENGKNAPMFDLNKPLGYGQFLRAFNSGGAAGGPSVATDGETVWAYCAEAGPRFVYRTDGQKFGDGVGANRRNIYIPDSYVTALAAWRDPSAARSFVYLAERGRMVGKSYTKGPFKRTAYSESPDDLANRVTVLAGEDARELAHIAVDRPLALAVQGGRLHVLHADGNGWAVSSVALKDGLPSGEWRRAFAVPATITPFDLEVDKSGRCYLSDTAANKVYQLDAKGRVIRTYGRLPVQQPGAYDPETLMSPGKLATWTDADGHDRLIITEYAGPNRVSEWSADSGKLLREFASYQTKANGGYAFDPADASLVYVPGQQDWLTRFKIDYATGRWAVDAVWPGVRSGQRKGLDKPVAIRRDGRLYLASEQNLTIYRLDGDTWKLSAGLETRDKDSFLWSDANGNGAVDDDELRPANLPGKVLTYHGQRWLQDLSYLAMAQGGKDVWRLAPDHFDEQGNPVFTAWQKVVTDPVFAARAAGTADAVHGGNEMADSFSSDWMQADGTVADGFYVQARGGKNFSANEGAQHKITRYVPDGKGGYALKWRVGRTALEWTPRRGELIGGMRLFRPHNGILTVVDQSRSGLFLYTTDGLYVDTLFTPGGTKDTGMYAQPGEFFAGTIVANDRNGKIYYAAGKYTPLVYEMNGWSLTDNPVHPLTTVQPTVSLAAADTGTPPEIALTLRGGVGTTSVVRFLPALGGVALDGSMTGWESAEPVVLESDMKTVQVRCMYEPETLYLRWHVRLNAPFAPRPLPPLERLFTHDQETETVGFYFQGDPQAPPPKNNDGRPGDVRFVLGLFKDGGKTVPALAGMYPRLDHPNAHRQTYRTPVGEVTFDHVGAVPGIRLGQSVDDDGKGFVIVAAIPRSAIPALKSSFGANLRTQVNFDANLGGHDKFWWANQDGSASRETYDEPTEARLYPGSWGGAQFEGIADGVVVRHWQVLGPFGGPGAEAFKNDPQGPMKDAVHAFFEKAVFPPDGSLPALDASYSGPMVQGWWKNPGKVAWKPAGVADLDTRVILGPSAEVWYGATWIYAPVQTEVDFEFQMHPMTPVRWFLNNERVPTGTEKDYRKTNNRLHLLTLNRAVTLKAGWNQIHFRGYNYGYTPFRLGLVVNAAPEKLWTLRFSDMPPASAPGEN